MRAISSERSVDVSPARRDGALRNAVARLRFDAPAGSDVHPDPYELCRDEQVEIDAARLPNLTIYPLQVMHLRAVEFLGHGL